ncbi:acetamidase regulatory protein [Purpureocillium lavendulum]|uniref:Acetamidase regulatory protein n=1 Tax=Purpureocillium lavendulum TaxID=1247861 RepID=A0AB34G2W9_9HYPO|nr:acetamidase regulatory protein [Purpureocillium lavendulum]
MVLTSYLYVISSASLAVLIYAILKLVQHRKFYTDLWRMTQPKPPGHSLLFGHLKLFGEIVKLFPAGTHPQYYYTYLARKYSLPDVFYVDLWPIGPSQVVITGCDASAQVTAVRSYPMHPAAEEYLAPMIGENVIAAANGALWKKLHHMLAPAFTPRSVKTLLGPIADKVLLFHGRLRELASAGDAFAMEEEMARLVFDVIGGIVFGVSLNAQKSGSPILADLRAILDLSQLIRTSWNPIVAVRARWSRRQAVKRSDTFLRTRLVSRYQAMKSEKDTSTRQGQGALSILDRIVLDRIQNPTSAADDGLDQDFLKIAVNNLKGLLIGGHGTTTDTLCFIYMMLGLYPEVLSRLRQEHDQIFAPSLQTTCDMLRESPAKTNELEYTSSVIMETLRIFPVGFGIRQSPPNEPKLHLKSGSYPTADHMIILCQHATHFDPTNFPEPSAFVPDRFLSSYSGPKPHRFAWRPFERGPRACMGQELAMEEMRIVLLLTVRWFDFEAVVNPQTISKVPKVAYTDWDTKIGDLAFQELKLGASPRDGMRMRVSASQERAQSDV